MSIEAESKRQPESMSPRFDPRSLISPIVFAAVAAALASFWGASAAIAAGLAAIGAALAVAFREEFRKPDKSPSDSGVGQSVNGVLVLGDTELADAMRQALTQIEGSSAQGNLRSAPILFVDHGDDVETAAEIERQVAGGAQAALVAHIRDPMFRHLIQERLEAIEIEPRPTLFSLASIIARELIHKERLFDQAYWRDQPRLHALVIGFTALGRSCMEEAIFAGIAGDLAPPRVTIVDSDPDRVRGLFARHMSELAKSVEVEILSLDFLALADAASGPLAAAEEAAPFTAIFVCLPDEHERIALMGILSTLQTHHDRALAPVFVLSENCAEASAIARPLGRDRDMARRFVVAGGPPADPYAALVSSRGDVTAERLHEVYRKIFGGQGASAVPWSRLHEAYRDANRHAARHLPQKLWTAGLTWFGSSLDTGAVVSEAYSTIIEPCAKSTGEDALMRRLARLEHDRWCAERRLGGWSFGSSRDESRQRHPNLISFDDPRFTDRDIAKDIEQIRYLFGAVAVPSPDGASAPIVIGVASAESLDGIDVQAAVNILAVEPWRPVLLLSALADEGECRIVETLITSLRGSGRAIRLFVVEQRGADAFSAASTVSCDLRNTLLAQPTTLKVPIGVAAELGEAWTDPEAPTDDGQALADYMRRRASAIVVRDEPRTMMPAASPVLGFGAK
jgi:hypothetical protein